MYANQLDRWMDSYTDRQIQIDKEWQREGFIITPLVKLPFELVGISEPVVCALLTMTGAWVWVPLEARWALIYLCRYSLLSPSWTHPAMPVSAYSLKAEYTGHETMYGRCFRVMLVPYVELKLQPPNAGWVGRLLELYLLATSKVISGWIPTCDSANS